MTDDIERTIIETLNKLHDYLGREYTFESTINVKHMPEREDYHFSRVTIEMESEEVVGQKNPRGHRKTSTTTTVDYYFDDAL